MSAEISKLTEEDWQNFKWQAASQLAFYFGITPYQEQQILTGFERMTQDIESGESWISKEKFADLIESILLEADKNTFM